MSRRLDALQPAFESVGQAVGVEDRRRDQPEAADQVGVPADAEPLVEQGRAESIRSEEQTGDDRARDAGDPADVDQRDEEKGGEYRNCSPERLR